MNGRIVRAPNHLGDVVLALPAILADGADVLVVRGLAPILRMALAPERVIPFDRGLRGWSRAVSVLRRGDYDAGVLLTPSFSAAWMMHWGGVGDLRGTATDARSWMLREKIDPVDLEPLHRINQYRLILGQDTDVEPRSHRLEVPRKLSVRWGSELRGGGVGRLVGLFPGANAPARRWPTEGFEALARNRIERGDRVVVIGGPGEREVTARVAAAAPGAVDLGGRTTIEDLAAVLSALDLLVTNDTGPMHLAGAVGTPTVSLWGSSDPNEVRQTGAPDFGVTGPDLPCKPCYRNHCARRGAGTILDEAHEECMKLITTDQVLEATDRALEAGVS
ncbi:MAG: glycosyltransferase family 9 protein [Gemmatimonadota bacterium]